MNVLGIVLGATLALFLLYFLLIRLTEISNDAAAPVLTIILLLVTLYSMWSYDWPFWDWPPRHPSSEKAAQKTDDND